MQEILLLIYFYAFIALLIWMVILNQKVDKLNYTIGRLTKTIENIKKYITNVESANLKAADTEFVSVPVE